MSNSDTNYGNLKFSIELLRQKYYFNNQTKSALVDFVLVGSQDFDSSLSAQKIINDPAFQVTFKDEEEQEFVATYNEIKKCFEFIYTQEYEEKEGLYLYFEDKTNEFCGYYNWVKEKDKEYFLKKESESQSIQHIIQYNTKSTKWQIKRCDSSAPSDDVIFMSKDSNCNSNIPPVEFEPYDKKSTYYPFVLWKENGKEDFQHKFNYQICLDEKDNEGESSSSSVLVEESTIDINFVSDDIPEYLVGTKNDSDKVEYGNQEINIGHAYSEFDLNINLVEKVYFQMDNNEESPSDNLSLSKWITENGNESLPPSTQGSYISLNKHIFRNLIIDVDSEGCKVYKATQTANKNITFSEIQELIKSNNLQAQNKEIYNKFNDDDFRIIYNKEKGYWEIKYLPYALVNTKYDPPEISESSSSTESSSSANPPDGEESSSSIEILPEDIDINGEFINSDVFVKNTHIPLTFKCTQGTSIITLKKYSSTPDNEDLSTPDNENPSVEENVSLCFVKNGDECVVGVDNSIILESGQFAFVFNFNDDTNNNMTFSKSEEEYYYFEIKDYIEDSSSLTEGSSSETINCRVEAFGNVNSLLGLYDSFDEFVTTLSPNSIVSVNPVNLTDYCFYKLFYNCEALTKASLLPATILAESCYESMFEGCVNLNSTPYLPARKAVTDSYKNMFKGCEKIKNIFINADQDLGNITPFSDMAESNVTAIVKQDALDKLQYNKTITFEQLQGVQQIQNEEDEKQYLRLTCKDNVDSNIKIKLNKHGDFSEDWHIYYRTCYKYEHIYITDQGTFSETRYETSHWIQYDFNNTTISLMEDEWVQFENVNTTVFSKDKDNYLYFSMTFEDESSSKGFVCASGNIQSLLGFNDENKTTEYCFYRLFAGCDLLKTTPILPATTLAKGCYESMFEGCASLIYAPELPATTLYDYCYQSMFKGCVSLIKASELSATTLADYCYVSMFDGCTSLIYTPVLSVTELANYCYQSMFKGCASLIYAPKLPATKLTENCYQYIFQDCTSLIYAPKLPATKLAKYCYEFMFAGCASLTETPILPATELVDYCYASMFSGCTLLKEAPVLSAETLAKGCYEFMFAGCTSLEETPLLPATTLAEHCYDSMFERCTSLKQTQGALNATKPEPFCYYEMFKDCTSLKEAPNIELTTVEGNCLDYMFFGCESLTYIAVAFHFDRNSWSINKWVEGVNSNGIFKKPKKLIAKYGADNIPENFQCSVNISGGSFLTFQLPTESSSKLIFSYSQENDETMIPKYNKPFTISYEPEEIDSSSFSSSEPKVMYVTFTSNSSSKAKLADNFLYRILKEETDYDGEFLKIKDYKGSEKGIMLNQGESMQIINMENILNEKEEYLQFCAKDEDGNDFVGKVTFSGNINSLINYQPLISNNEYCFYKLFYNCKCVTSIKDLYFTNNSLSNHCYDAMFRGCTNLVEAQTILYGQLAESCYESMFKGCDKLTKAPILPATTLAEYCYRSMFAGCTSLEEAPILPATILASNCYQYMFKDCTSLRKAPALPATILAHACYELMFAGCTSLTKAPALPTVTVASSCYREMFENCRSLTVAPELPATTLAHACYDSMFQDCTSLTEAPELPATTLAESCYASMFKGCTSLRKAPALPATTLAHACYEFMFAGCTSLVNMLSNYLPSTDNKSQKVILRSSCYASMFAGCTSLSTQMVILFSDSDESSYDSMFSGCSNLKTLWLKFNASENSSFAGFNNLLWLPELSSQDGAGILNVVAGDDDTIITEDSSSSIPTGWSIKEKTEEDLPDYKVITNSSSSSSSSSIVNLEYDSETTEKINNIRSYLSGIFPEIYYDTYFIDKQKSLYPINRRYVFGTAIDLSNVEKIQFYNMNGVLSQSSERYFNFKVINGENTKLKLTGSVQSMIAFKECSPHCFQNLFSNLTQLEEIDESEGLFLPATTLAVSCYESMFAGCTSLTKAPQLPATTLVDDCYESMFNGCSKLSYIKFLFQSWESSTIDSTFNVPTLYWLENVSPTGKYECQDIILSNLDNAHQNNSSYIPEGWINDNEGKKINWEKAITFTNDSSNSTIQINIHEIVTDETLQIVNRPEIYYYKYYGDYSSTYAGDKYKFDVNSVTPDYIELSLGQHVKFYNTNSIFSNQTKQYQFQAQLKDESLTGDSLSAEQELNVKLTVSGHISSLLQGNNNTAELLFANMNLLTDASGLKIADDESYVLTDYQCKSMFAGCTRLIAAPELPATTLAKGCYQSMFEGCTSLTAAPELPAETLAESCYKSMFAGCSKLQSVSPLNALILKEDSYKSMFTGCYSLSTLLTYFTGYNSSEGGFNLEDLEDIFVDLSQYNDSSSSSIEDFSAPYKLKYLVVSQNFYEFIQLEQNQDFKKKYNEYGVTYIDHTTYNENLQDDDKKGLIFSEKNGKSFIITVKHKDETIANVVPLIYDIYNENDESTLEQRQGVEIGNKITVKSNQKIEVMINSNTKDCSNIRFEISPVSQNENLQIKVEGGISYQWGNGLFEGLTVLVDASGLSFTDKTLTESCYASMFAGCTSLTKAPELPAETLAKSCYESMFEGCTSLTAAPKLPATTLVESCYASMFKGCTSLRYIEVGFKEWINDATTQWTSGVSNYGQFIISNTLSTYIRGVSYIPQGWCVNNIFTENMTDEGVVGYIFEQFDISDVAALTYNLDFYNRDKSYYMCFGSNLKTTQVENVINSIKVVKTDENHFKGTLLQTIDFDLENSIVDEGFSFDGKEGEIVKNLTLKNMPTDGDKFEFIYQDENYQSLSKKDHYYLKYAINDKVNTSKIKVSGNCLLQLIKLNTSNNKLDFINGKIKMSRNYSCDKGHYLSSVDNFNYAYFQKAITVNAIEQYKKVFANLIDDNKPSDLAVGYQFKYGDADLNDFNINSVQIRSYLDNEDEISWNANQGEYPMRWTNTNKNEEQLILTTKKEVQESDIKKLTYSLDPMKLQGIQLENSNKIYFKIPFGNAEGLSNNFTRNLYVKFIDKYGNYTSVYTQQTFIYTSKPQNLTFNLIGSAGEKGYTGFYKKHNRLFPSQFVKVDLYADSQLEYDLTYEIYHGKSSDNINKLITRGTIGDSFVSLILKLDPFTTQGSLFNQNMEFTFTLKVIDIAGNFDTISSSIQYISHLYRSRYESLVNSNNQEEKISVATKVNNSINRIQQLVNSKQYTRDWNEIFFPDNHKHPVSVNGMVDIEQAKKIDASNLDYDQIQMSNGDVLYDDQGRCLTVWNQNKLYSSNVNNKKYNNSFDKYWIIENKNEVDYHLEFEHFYLNDEDGQNHNLFAPDRGDLVAIYDVPDDAVSSSIDNKGNQQYTLTNSNKLTLLMILKVVNKKIVMDKYSTVYGELTMNGTNSFTTPSFRGHRRLCIVPFTDGGNNASGFKIKAGKKSYKQITNYDLIENSGEFWIHRHNDSGEILTDNPTIYLNYKYYQTWADIDNDKSIISLNTRPTYPIVFSGNSLVYLKYDKEKKETVAKAPHSYFDEAWALHSFAASQDDWVDYYSPTLFANPSGLDKTTDDAYDFTKSEPHAGKLLDKYTMIKDIGIVTFDLGTVPKGRIAADYSYHTFYRLTSDGYGDLYFYGSGILVPATGLTNYTDFTYVDLKIINEGDNALLSGTLQFLARGYITSSDVVDTVLDQNRPWDIQQGSVAETVQRTGAVSSSNFNALPIGESRANAIQASAVQTCVFGTLQPQKHVYLRVWWCIANNSEGTSWINVTKGQKVFSSEISGVYMIFE